jgi:hypothetical protein
MTLARHLRDLRLAPRLSACRTRRCGVAVGGAVAACCPRVKGPLQGRTQPTRHGRTASKTVRGTGRGAGRGGGVAREPLSGLPGLRLHLLVGRAVTFVGGLVPGIGEVVTLVGGPLPRVGSAWASSRAAARRASPAWAACNAAPACARLAPQRPHPGVVHGKADDPLTLGLLDNLLGEVGHPPRGCLVS